MLNILMIHPQYREYRRELFTALSRNFNIKYLFIVGLPDEKTTFKISDKISYKSLDLKDKRFLPNDKGPGLKLVGILKLIYFLSRELLTTNSNIIITSTENSLHSKISFFWCKIIRKKIIIWTETWNIPKRKNILLKASQKFSNFFLINSDAVLVHGTNQKKYCMDIGIPEEKIFLFNHSCNDKAIYPVKENIRESLQIKNKKIVLYIGRLIKIKGVEILLKAFKRLENDIDDVFLLLVGKGEYEHFLKNLSRELGIKNILFYGDVYPDLTPSFYKVADVFCLPSYIHKGRGGEGWGLVVNEAASMGLPIITTNAVGCVPDLLKDGYNGFIVKNGSVEELYNAIKKILFTNELRRKMAKNSRMIFEDFNDFNKIVDNLKKAIKFSEK